MTLLYLSGALFAALLVAFGTTSLQLARLRRRGIYPAPGAATMSDVERLLHTGHRVWAVRCYREIHGCSLQVAKQAVDSLHVT